MFRWLAPKGLFFLAFDVVISGIFGRYADKRELEGAMPAQKPARLDGDDVWLDYVADTGDGWNATYTVAWLLAQERLAIAAPHADLVTERGAALIMGGDEVYPKASEDVYECQLRAPYRAAQGGRDEDRMLFAIPGNHDWYDGLTSFLRTFCQNPRFAGWKTPQRRSYFSIQLPHRWWVLGIDIAFDYYLDQAQLAYFDGLRCTKQHWWGEDRCDHVHPGDRIILCTAKPGWEEAKIRGDFRSVKQTVGRRALFEFEQRLVEAWGCELKLVLSGDLHHYAHYVSSSGGAHRITAGGGGAFFYPTHAAPDEVPWPSEREDPRRSQDRLRLERVFPEKAESRSWWPAIIVAPIVANLSFAVFAGALYSVLASIVPGGIADPQVGLAMFKPPDARPLFVIAVIGLYFVFRGFADAKTRWGAWLIGLGHWAAQLAALLGTILAGHRLAAWLMEQVHRGHGRGDLVFAATTLAAVVVIGGLAGGLVMGLYLFVAQLFGRHPNEAFAALHLSRYKNFLRMHLERDRLTIYPFSVDRVCSRWVAKPNGVGPYFAPASPVTVELIGAPIEIPF
jgi:hypothetical protein